MATTTNKPMGKTELIAAIGELIGNREVAADAVAALVGVINRQAAVGREVRITGFLSIKPHLLPARTFRNPKTGSEVQRQARWSVKVKVGSELETAAASRKP
ncbi:HU family DNA-binding protein [Nonomuraea sp. NPDC047529]|uniref:HU family DNA-binding protein n=1 Tax=Nonomuraea sp. NPDC047529 TaxID=3155623 RepID=UPI0033F96A74